jgi:hypothetical protein
VVTGVADSPDSLEELDSSLPLEDSDSLPEEALVELDSSLTLEDSDSLPDEELVELDGVLEDFVALEDDAVVAVVGVVFVLVESAGSWPEASWT